MYNSSLSNPTSKINKDSVSASLGNTTKSPHPPRSKYYLQDVSKRLLNNKRLSACCRATKEHDAIVTINQHKSGGLSYGNLIKCGSVWVCPVCASKLVNHRRDDLGKLIDVAGVTYGASMAMLTLTVPHGFTDTLGDTLERISHAKELMQHRKTWKTLAKRIGLIGQIRTLEVTYGANGWHPHFHIVLFTERPIKDVKWLTADILDAWQSACTKENLPLPNKHGVDLRIATRKGLADYIQKWGIDYEMCNGGQSKKPNKAGRTPFQLLADSETDERAAWLFQEYAKCFKGKRQLVYSRGLRERFHVEEELTDDQIMELENKDTTIVAEIEGFHWRGMLKDEAEINKRMRYLKLPRLDLRNLILETFRIEHSVDAVNEQLELLGISPNVRPPILS